MSRLAVIGAGAGGMAAALLAQKHDIATVLFEAHALPGGCAGWFRRGKFSFDVGATTISGVAPGQPLDRLRELTGAPLELIPADPGIVFHLPDQIFFRHRDPEAWLAELSRVFPGVDHRRFWSDIDALARRAWKLLPAMRGFPPQQLGDLTHALAWLKGVGLLPQLLQSLTSYRRLRQGDRELLSRWLDSLCMISAQNRAEQVPALIGSLALTYPAETFAPRGGMEGFFTGWLEHFKALGGEWRPKHEVTSLHQQKLWSVDGEEFSEVVCNLTGWKLRQLLRQVPELPRDAWGAFTLYAGVRLARPQPHPYHLVMSETVGDYFVSFSSLEDPARAPAGWQTVTLSQHCTSSEWALPEEDYQQKKRAQTESVWKDFSERFGLQECQHLTAGTPRTFERYTRRPFGFVGGLPHRWAYPLWRWPQGKVAPGLTQVSDTVFPGQGIVAVVTRALNWWEDLGANAHFERRR